MRRDTFLGLFNDSFPPVMDGVTLTVQNYAEWFQARGANPCVVTPRMEGLPHTDYPIECYFSLPIASRHPYRYGYPKLDFTIRRRLRGRPFRLVHSHSPFSAGRLARYTAERQGIPLVGTFHSKYRTDLEHSFRMTPWMVKIIMGRVLDFFNACDQVWIPQAEVEETLREYGFRGKPVTVPNGNDMTHVDERELPAYKARCRRELGFPSGAVALLFVGQHIWPKGIGFILEVLEELRRRDIAFVMNYIGTGYALAELKERIVRLGLEDRVKVHGVCHDREELARYYAASDLFLFPSLYDNAPLVVREAAAMATPALIPQGSTAGAAITDGENGLLPPLTAGGYADAIALMSGDPEGLLRMGLKARRTLCRSWQQVMEEVDGRYAELIKTHKPR